MWAIILNTGEPGRKTAFVSCIRENILCLCCRGARRFGFVQRPFRSAVVLVIVLALLIPTTRNRSGGVSSNPCRWGCRCAGAGGERFGTAKLSGPTGRGRSRSSIPRTMNPHSIPTQSEAATPRVLRGSVQAQNLLDRHRSRDS